MHVKDLDGKRVEVTDLHKALEQASMFKQFRHDDTSFKELDDRLNAYWSDLHDKLVALHKEQNTRPLNGGENSSL
jgi:hypothetical protein